jgi:hypothetical protein
MEGQAANGNGTGLVGSELIWYTMDQRMANTCSSYLGRKLFVPFEGERLQEYDFVVFQRMMQNNLSAPGAVPFLLKPIRCDKSRLEGVLTEYCPATDACALLPDPDSVSDGGVLAEIRS